ncbi:hypothetical protein P171DRAFT_48892 [Karstenula rhodostoma CBS 690.94]|uniref:Uncharacterized protein n=1 Tax=Karstenula rhodostoma CBS 690.94 TaxID=1392251 RepID=A0A9P4U8W6_9PLEO|nr:hypothetical protein P171DRAFT_48892 [Karstenula rhodostoma CBS 690.94]
MVLGISCLSTGNRTAFPRLLALLLARRLIYMTGYLEFRARGGIQQRNSNRAHLDATASWLVPLPRMYPRTWMHLRARCIRSASSVRGSHTAASDCAQRDRANQDQGGRCLHKERSKRRRTMWTHWWTGILSSASRALAFACSQTLQRVDMHTIMPQGLD